MATKEPIVIVGAGMAGLTAAKFLKENNIPFVLYEAGTKIAGLATSFRDKEGFSYDFGAHFITNRLAKAIGISSECRLVKHYGETVWLKGKAYRYPFGLIKIPHIAVSWLETRLKSFSNGKESSSAADWFRKRYGPALANEIALPLIESWSGMPGDELSPALGKGLFGGSVPKTFFLKAAGVITGRAIACGYNKERSENPAVWHVYPNGGLSTLCEKLAEDVTDSIQLESPVQEIIVENEKVVAVKVKGELKKAAAVISTAPVNILSKLVKGTSLLEATSGFRYRPMIFINLKFEGRHLLPDTVLWFPEKDFIFFRLTESTQSMPWLAPEGKTIITADIGCEKGDALWEMDEKELAALCLEKLNSIIPDAKKRFLGSSVLRTPIAYPVFLNKYEQERQNFVQSTHIDNLLSIGRNGEFSHMFMEDVYWRTRKKVNHLIKQLYH